MVKRKSKFKPFKELGNAAIGTAGLGVITTVGAGVASRAPAGTVSLTGGFSTLAGFVPVVNTAIGGKVALESVKRLKTKKRKKTFF